MHQSILHSKICQLSIPAIAFESPALKSILRNKLIIVLLILFSLSSLTTFDAAAQDAALVKPTQAKFIEDLKTVVDQLEKKQYAETEKYFFLPPNFTTDKFAGLLDRNVISAAGISVLDHDGKFGMATEVLGEQRANSFAKEFDANIAQCYAMLLEQPETTAEIMAQWDGTLFKIMRLNRVGYLIATNDEASDNAEAAKMPSGDEPTKQLMLDSLAVILSQLQNRHYGAAKEHFFLPPDFKPEMFAKLLEINEISKAGLEVLGQNGKFGPAAEIFEPQRAAHFADRVKIPVGQCFGIKAEIDGEQGEAMAQWTGNKFKFIRIDDIGKLAPIANKE